MDEELIGCAEKTKINMTSEVNEGNIVASPTSSVANNDPASNCRSPAVIPSTKVSSNEPSNCKNLSDNVPPSDKVAETKFDVPAQANETTRGCKKDLSDNQEEFNNKFPSRWASKIVDQSLPDEKHLQSAKIYKNCHIESTSSGNLFECSTPINAPIRTSNMICDSDSSALPCATTAVNSLNLVGDDRARLGKEAIEKLASELNKAATTIQDFTQNVSGVIVVEAIPT